MQKRHSKFNAQELFDSLSPQERDQIWNGVLENTRERDHSRYSRLEKAEIAKQEIVQKLEIIEYQIAENDEWFLNAKQTRIEVTNENLDLHKRKAGELYSRKKAILDSELPRANAFVHSVVAQIEFEECQESIFQQRDLERLLEPVYERQERERTSKIVDGFKERERLREAERAKAYEELLLFLNEQERERNQKEDERWKKSKELIRGRTIERGIPYLVHFTPVNNLPSILANGLQSRNRLAGQNYIWTDEYRTDGWLGWISLSVGFPNYKMFYSKRNSVKEVNGWALILIRRDILWESECKFILTNAASSGIRMFGDTRWSGIEAFEDMFGNHDHRLEIPDFYTTDPQAEVMVRDEVPRHYLERVVVKNRSEAERLVHLPDIHVEIIPELFKGRKDFEHWRQFRLSAFSSANGLVTPF